MAPGKKSRAETGPGLKELLLWLEKLKVISEHNRKQYLENPPEFLTELCYGTILPKLAVLADPVMKKLRNVKMFFSTTWKSMKAIGVCSFDV